MHTTPRHRSRPFQAAGRALAAALVLVLAALAGDVAATGMDAATRREMAPVDPLVDRLARLAPAEELALYLGPGAFRVEGRRYSESARLARLVDDPALAGVYATIDDRWLADAVAATAAAADGEAGALLPHTRGAVETKVMVARNLHFRGRAATAATVRDEVARILELRRRYRETTLFRGREVLYAASDDELDGGRGHLFGRLPTRQRLGLLAARFDFLRRGETRGDVHGRLAAAMGSASPFTFVFEGHGREGALKLDGALSVRALARGLAGRPAAAATPILVLDACQSHTFSRRLLDELDRVAPTVQPILVTPEEYGQDFVKVAFGDQFLEQDLGIGYRDTVPLGVLLDGARPATSVYVPGDDGRPAQIL